MHANFSFCLILLCIIIFEAVLTFWVCLVKNYVEVRVENTLFLDLYCRYTLDHDTPDRDIDVNDNNGDNNHYDDSFCHLPILMYARVLLCPLLFSIVRLLSRMDVFRFQPYQSTMFLVCLYDVSISQTCQVMLLVYNVPSQSSLNIL